MTPDDKRRLAEIDELGLLFDDVVPSSVALDLRRLLDEAMAETAEVRAGWRREHENWTSEIQEIVLERDAAMAALRDIVVIADDALAAHSAATKPTEVVSG